MGIKMGYFRIIICGIAVVNLLAMVYLTIRDPQNFGEKFFQFAMGTSTALFALVDPTKSDN